MGLVDVKFTIGFFQNEKGHLLHLLMKKIWDSGKNEPQIHVTIPCLSLLGTGYSVVPYCSCFFVLNVFSTCI